MSELREATPDPALADSVIRDGVPIRMVLAADPLGVDAFITTRDGGVSAPPFDSLNLGDHVGDDDAHVADNRRRVARAIGVTTERLVIASQVHGSTVIDASDSAPRVGDVITCSATELAVAILVADCVPLLLVAPDRHALVVVHAGWRGLDAGVITAAVSAVGGPGERIIAVVGPRISGAAYQVGPEVARHFTDIPGAVASDIDDRSRLDLGVVAVHQLGMSGVAVTDIHVSSAVTDGGAEFFSDRAARPCGRFGLVAKWRT